MHTFAETDRVLWLVQQRQRELINEATQQRIAHGWPMTGPAEPRASLVSATIARSRGLAAAARALIRPEPCTDPEPDCA